MVITDSVVKIRTFDRKSGAAVTPGGTGTVIHADPQRALILTVAHIIEHQRSQDVRRSPHFRDRDAYNRVMRYLVTRNGEETGVSAQYLCIPESGNPDIGLLMADNSQGIFSSALAIAKESVLSVSAGGRILGYAADEFICRSFQGQFRFTWQAEKFPRYETPGNVPVGFSGAPLLSKGKIMGIVEERTQGKIEGSNCEAIHRMLSNWAAGKYVSPPCAYLPEGELPQIVDLPPEIKTILGQVLRGAV